MLKFNEDFIKNYDEDGDKEYILKLDVKDPKNLHYLHSDFPSLKLINAINLYAICMMTMLVT